MIRAGKRQLPDSLFNIPAWPRAISLFSNKPTILIALGGHLFDILNIFSSLPPFRSGASAVFPCFPGAFQTAVYPHRGNRCPVATIIGINDSNIRAVIDTSRALVAFRLSRQVWHEERKKEVCPQHQGEDGREFELFGASFSGRSGFNPAGPEIVRRYRTAKDPLFYFPQWRGKATGAGNRGDEAIVHEVRFPSQSGTLIFSAAASHPPPIAL